MQPRLRARQLDSGSDGEGGHDNAHRSGEPAVLKCSFRPRKHTCEVGPRLPAESGSDFNICTYLSIMKRQLIDLDFSIREKKTVDKSGYDSQPSWVGAAHDGCS